MLRPEKKEYTNNNEYIESLELFIDHLMDAENAIVKRGAILIEPDEPFDDHIWKLGISSRTRNILANCQILRLIELTQYTKQETLRFRNFGPVALKEIEQQFKLWGYKFKK